MARSQTPQLPLNHPVMNKRTLDIMMSALSCFTDLECMLAEYEIATRHGRMQEANEIRQRMIACWRKIKNTAVILEEGGYA